MVDERSDGTGEGRTPPTTPSPSADASNESRTAPTSIPRPSASGDSLRVGQILGDRYEIRSRLGAGGMGEVWLATDLKLRIDVALKSVRPDYLANERLRELLRREVLAAREVLSPNVCRVFDLEVAEGLELVSMEYVSGRTLAELLKERAPLLLGDARDIAAQFLAGLEAIHDAGLVHRDFKPENVMITPVGRVVVMDLGLAARPELMDGGAAGTPAYMPPEQARGGPVDARADVFAAGVVLAEMIAPSGIREREKRITLWEGLRAEPPRLPETPWTPVMRTALAREASGRFGSAREMSRELDGLTLRVEEGEGVEPYPGLSAFTEDNAERFFGREAEVEALLRKLGRARLLAIAGPSGAGKTSFVQAGLIPALSEGWGHLVVHPGDAPFEALVRELAERRRVARRGGGPPRHPEGAVPGSSPEGSLGRANGEILRRVASDGAPQDDGGLSGDGLVGALRRWREGHEQALLVVDQLEELFTLNPPETQERFARLLGQLPVKADVHVLLSMRDDFLLRCREHEALEPVFAELTPLVHPTGAALRRALVQPALSCGYRFEDERLVESMLGQVEHERGALPLLAFAAARLWDKRDQDEGALTRAAYEEIGGVGGALAHHAEETLERIGSAGTPTVRELFRNLVTAEGTRAARDREELLSVFPEPERDRATMVLDTLIDARLLTSFEVRESRGAAERPEEHLQTTVPLSSAPGAAPSSVRQRIEIIHESLLSAWPRLVRWQTQDADAAQLRDQLRQAAQAWAERGGSADLLWTGSAYREFAVWRERYQGGLSSTEAAFAVAMEEHASRRRRWRRAAVAAVLTVAAGVAVVTSVLWQRSDAALRRAEVEVRQREAAQLLSLGRLRLEGHPTAALAYAMASLERFDNEPSRRFALQALSKSPPAFQISDPINAAMPSWSPDGRWLAIGGTAGLLLVDGNTGERHRLADAISEPVGFSTDSSRLVASTPGKLLLWSIPDRKHLETWDHPTLTAAGLFDRRLRFLESDGVHWEEQPEVVRERSIDGGPVTTLGRWPGGASDPSGEWRYSVENGLLVRRSTRAMADPPRVLGRHEGRVSVRGRPWPDRVVTADTTGRVRIWEADTGRVERSLQGPTGARSLALDPAGRFIAVAPGGGGLPPRSLHVFDLAAPRGASPFVLANDEVNWLNRLRFHPDGSLLASGHFPVGVLLWNLTTPRAMTFEHKGPNSAIAFTPEGRLVSTSDDGVARVWPLEADPASDAAVVWPRGKRTALGFFLAVGAECRCAVALERGAGQVIRIPLDGGSSRVYEIFESILEHEQGQIASVTLAPDGRRLAVAYSHWKGRPSVRILDMETAEVTKLEDPASTDWCVVNSKDLGPIQRPYWLQDGRLVTDGAFGLLLWDLEEGSSEPLRPCRDTGQLTVLATPDSQTVLTLFTPMAPDEPSTILAFDLQTRTSREITTHGNKRGALALDSTGTILVSGDATGLVRVGLLDGGEPHLLYGHAGNVASVAVSPDGRWVASAGDDNTIRLWPMPDVSKPPLHTLPSEELLEKLRSLTNLRVVVDPGSADGYAVEPGPFRGWAEIPTW